MEMRDKITAIERKFGGPVAAARAAGVEYPTWYRWRKSLPTENKRVANLLDLLLESVNGNSDPLPAAEPEKVASTAT